MCRILGQCADPENDAGELLCSVENALRHQSHKHPHGWGIGWYVAGRVRVRRGVRPAHEDEDFARAAHAVRSRLVIAHVRDASVGPVAVENTHPFKYGSWLFAHNGTIQRYRRTARVRAAIEAEIDPALRKEIRGDTDSERCFYLFLTRLAARVPRGRHPGVDAIRGALCDAVETLAGIADAGAAKPSSMNFLVSDGRVLAACRRGRTLFTSSSRGPLRRFAVASERIGPAAWTEVPEGGFVAVDESLRLVASPLRLGRRRRVA